MKIIPVKGKSAEFYAMVDDCDAGAVSSIKWTLHSAGYATGKHKEGGKWKNILMHRLVLGAKNGDQVDHISGIKLDNRRQNLRFCTQAQNQCNTRNPKSNNTSGYTGVCLDKKRNKWYAQITVSGVVKTVGAGFSSKEDALICRNEAARKQYGEFAFIQHSRTEARA